VSRIVLKKSRAATNRTLLSSVTLLFGRARLTLSCRRAFLLAFDHGGWSCRWIVDDASFRVFGCTRWKGRAVVVHADIRVARITSSVGRHLDHVSNLVKGIRLWLRDGLWLCCWMAIDARVGCQWTLRDGWRWHRDRRIESLLSLGLRIDSAGNLVHLVAWQAELQWFKHAESGWICWRGMMEGIEKRTCGIGHNGVRGGRSAAPVVVAVGILAEWMKGRDWSGKCTPSSVEAARQVAGTRDLLVLGWELRVEAIVRTTEVVATQDWIPHHARVGPCYATRLKDVYHKSAVFWRLNERG
jgi:hypothetical protein